MTHHLGYAKNKRNVKKHGNLMNGSYDKTVTGEIGEMDVKIPGDREGSFEPVILAKGQSRFAGFDDKIIAMYARAMTTRQIQGGIFTKLMV